MADGLCCDPDKGKMQAGVSVGPAAAMSPCRRRRHSCASAGLIWEYCRGEETYDHIRPERPTDADAIHDLTARAFAPMPFSEGTEAQIVRLLRDHGDLSLSLVAEQDGQVVGHVAFSPVTIGDAKTGWFGLGPISVDPALQKRGIGRSLIEAGLATLKERGAQGCALIGSPDLYSRFGFRSDGRLTYQTLDPAYLQWLAFDGPAPSGELTFAPAFHLATAEA